MSAFPGANSSVTRYVASRLIRPCTLPMPLHGMTSTDFPVPSSFASPPHSSAALRFTISAYAAASTSNVLVLLANR